MPSEYIAVIALVISLFSLWLSYRTTHRTKLLSAAERRTRAHATYTDVLLEADYLHSLVESALNDKTPGVIYPEGLPRIRDQLRTTIESAQQRLEWLRSKASHDPLKLEEYVSYALAVDANVKQISKMIRDLPVRIRNEAEPTAKSTI